MVREIESGRDVHRIDLKRTRKEKAGLGQARSEQSIGVLVCFGCGEHGVCRGYAGRAQVDRDYEVASCIQHCESPVMLGWIAVLDLLTWACRAVVV